MKKKITEEQRERLIDFLDQNTKAIIEAELQTYKEVEVSAHLSRMYIFTTLTMGIVELDFAGNRPDQVIHSVVERFKTEEYNTLSDDMKEIHHEHGSQLIALLLFLPATMLVIKDKKHPGFTEEDKEIYNLMETGNISPERVRNDPKYSKWKHLATDIINVQLESFYKNSIDIYKVIEHKDEVLDLPLFEKINTADTDGRGRLSNLKNLIEIE